MTIPLDRLRDFPFRAPGEGEISLAIARHQAAQWPSPEVTAYARHRSQLVHQLVEDTGVSVSSWGETDGEYPREVVEIVLALTLATIPAVATILAAWISRRPRKTETVEPDRPKPPADTAALLPGFSIRRSNGDELTMTYRDGLSNKEALQLATVFLRGAVTDGSTSH